MSLAQALFLAALSVLVVALVVFSGLVAAGALRQGTGSVATLPGVRATLRALELSSRSEASGGRWAYYLHRLSGVGVLGFLALHVVDVSLFAFSTSVYKRVHTLYSTPGLRVLECGLVFAVLFHTLNGLRLLAIDFFDLGRPTAQRLLTAASAVTVVAGVAAAIVILEPVL